MSGQQQTHKTMYATTSVANLECHSMRNAQCSTRINHVTLTLLLLRWTG
jgi:hypothetical protein